VTVVDSKQYTSWSAGEHPLPLVDDQLLLLLLTVLRGVRVHSCFRQTSVRLGGLSTSENSFRFYWFHQHQIKSLNRTRWVHWAFKTNANTSKIAKAAAQKKEDNVSLLLPNGSLLLPDGSLLLPNGSLSLLDEKKRGSPNRRVFVSTMYRKRASIVGQRGEF
jgi:hypothetical protein